MKTLLLSILTITFVLVAGAAICVMTDPTDTDMLKFGVEALIDFLISVIFYKHIDYKETIKGLKK